MENPKKILFQIDGDRLPSAFDWVVAHDSGIDAVQTYGKVEVADIESIVHGAIFTRKVSDLKSTAIFIGGSQIEQAEQLLKKVKQTFFGPMRVSVMMDASGANTTSAAAVRAVQQFVSLEGLSIAVFAATGSVGKRISQLLRNLSANVIVASRSLAKATELCEDLKHDSMSGTIFPMEIRNAEQTSDLLTKVSGVFSAGAAGIQLITLQQLEAATNLKFVVDLNAVPPTGIESIEANDFGEKRGHLLTFGAIGVGGLKMKIHGHCIASLFKSNDRIFDLNEIYKESLSIGSP